MPAYYNEIDPKAAAWLRELIRADLIAPGDVDERDIRDVRPNELAGYSQCHFFAGIGVWSYSLRLAGWPDNRPIWTGSCPCQPFSAAGKGEGFADERHLWPAWFHLIEQRRPVAIIGEQVSSDDGLTWLDVVRSDLEGATYAIGCADLCAAGVGAPHIRQRLFFVAEPDGRQRNRRPISPNWNERDGAHARRTQGDSSVAGCSSPGKLADSEGNRWRQKAADSRWGHEGDKPQGNAAGFESGGADGGELGVAAGGGRERVWHQPKYFESLPAGPTNGFWRDAGWIYCADGKWRPVEPGTFPLAHGAPARVVRLRGYGNAIVAPLSAEFIRAYLDSPGK